jgi:hypothetical protein
MRITLTRESETAFTLESVINGHKVKVAYVNYSVAHAIADFNETYKGG